MDELRYRKPSVKTVLGITRIKKRLNKALGMNKLLAPFRAVKNHQRRLLRRAGYYSPQMQMLRAAQHGQVPGPFGPIQLEESSRTQQEGKHQSVTETALLAAALTRGKEEDHPQSHEIHDQNGSGLAQVMLLATALQHQNQGNEQRRVHKERTGRIPASTAHAKQPEKHSRMTVRSHAHQRGK